MGVSFSTHSVHRTLIKVFQCSLIKQPTQGSIWVTVYVLGVQIKYSVVAQRYHRAKYIYSQLRMY
jgi:hypothetical protein